MTDIAEPYFVVELIFGNALGLLPHVGLVDADQILMLAAKVNWQARQWLAF